ncbi:MAG: glycosyltransferase [Chloroflexota bacterium]
MTQSDVDMVTVWSTQITETMAERLTVPLMAMVILGYLPTVMVHYSPFKAFAAANGQCMAWRREAYEAIGGHTSVANNVLDDVTMAHLAKEKGYRIRMVDGAGLVNARMYDGWQSARDGYAKNILAGYGNSVPALVAGGVFHWLVFLVPYGLLVLPDYRLAGVILLVMGFALRAVSAFWTRQRVLDTLLMPLSVLIFTWIAGQSIYWHYTGGARWKGRVISDAKSTQADIINTQKPIIRTDEG